MSFEGPFQLKLFYDSFLTIISPDSPQGRVLRGRITRQQEDYSFGSCVPATHSFPRSWTLAELHGCCIAGRAASTSNTEPRTFWLISPLPACGLSLSVLALHTGLGSSQPSGTPWPLLVSQLRAAGDIFSTFLWFTEKGIHTNQQPSFEISLPHTSYSLDFAAFVLLLLVTSQYSNRFCAVSKAYLSFTCPGWTWKTGFYCCYTNAVHCSAVHAVILITDID